MSLRKGAWTVGLSVLVAATVGWQSVTVAVTTADSLNVRSTPAGEVVDQVPLGTRVGVLRVNGSWARVMYLVNNQSDIRHGWVSIQYLRATSTGFTGYSSTCEDEYRSGAEVCLEVTDVDLDCDESISGDYYDECEADIDYELSTDYEGQSSIEAEVSCEAEVSYDARNGYGGSESDDDYYSHDLYNTGSEYGSMTLDFSFSRLDEAYDVELESTDCRIDDLTLR